MTDDSRTTSRAVPGTIGLLRLHRVGPTVPAEEQLGVLWELQQEGRVTAPELSEITEERPATAQRHGTDGTDEELTAAAWQRPAHHVRPPAQTPPAQTPPAQTPPSRSNPSWPVSC